MPGDGIGPEIMTEAVRVLRALDLKFELEEALLGGCAVDATGSPYPEATQKLAQAADAVLLGAVGGPQWDVLPREQRPERGLLGIRKQLGLFANLRPAILYPELANASTLKPVGAGENHMTKSTKIGANIDKVCLDILNLQYLIFYHTSHIFNES